MALVLTNFKAQENGFRFINRFEFPFLAPIKLPFNPFPGGKLVYGLCGGMCFAALDYFNAGKQVPSFSSVEDISLRLFGYLWDRQVDSLTLPVVLELAKWMVLDDWTLAQRVAHEKVDELCHSIDSGNPAVLALIRVKDIWKPTENHQVLATAYEIEPLTKKMTIHLYDPNHPGQAPTISLDLADPDHGINITQSTGEYLRGFFIINYAKQQPI